MRIRVTRRGFLKATAIPAIAGAAGCKALERGYPESCGIEKPPVPGAASWKPGEERFVKSVCLQCAGGCGIVVRVVEGRAVSIKGNPDFPTNQGGLCPKGQNGLQVLYDPDRVRGPLRASASAAPGNWTRISWDEAISESSQARYARANGESHAVACPRRALPRPHAPLVRRFLEAYGSPNDIDAESLCAGGEVVHELTQGMRERLAYDWERTRYVLVFGAGFVESFLPTAMMLRVHGQMRSGRPGERAKIVQIEPRCGVSGARADEWVCIEPGTDGALALGIAHVLIREGLYDKSFVSEHVLGFTRWTDRSGRSHMGFKDLVMERYAPAEVSKTTGVSAARIERLAREFAAYGPSVAVFGRGAAAHTNGLYNGLAIHALNALVGSIGRKGGVLVQRRPPLAEWPAPERDEIARRGLARPRVDLRDDTPPMAASRMASLHEALESGRPYPVKALFLYYTNPLFSAPDPARLRETMRGVAVRRQLLSLPRRLDRDGGSRPPGPHLPREVAARRHPAERRLPALRRPPTRRRAAPRHAVDGRGADPDRAGDRRVGGRAFPESELDMIKRLVRGAHESGRGSIRDDGLRRVLDEASADGGWWDPPYSFGESPRISATPSGKYEFYSTPLDERLSRRARRRRPRQDRGARRPGRGPGSRRQAGRDVLPALRAGPPGGNGRSTHSSCSYKTMTHAEGRGANQPHLQEPSACSSIAAGSRGSRSTRTDARALGVRRR